MPRTLRTAARALVWLLVACLFYTAAPAEEVPLRFTALVLEAPVGARIDVSEYLEGLPDNIQELSFSSSSPAVTVDGSGLAIAHEAGTARITVRRGDAEASILIRAYSEDIARRALIVSEQRYVDGRVRTGAVNTAQGLSDALNALRYRYGTPFEVTVRIDATQGELASLIAEALGEAEEIDVSLFYISCHGEMLGGEPHLVLHDGSMLSVSDLEKMLRPVRGRVLVLIDCCSSGAFIGRAASRLLAQSAAQSFAESALVDGKYLVLTSCGADEDSYRISDSGETSESAMSTVFARAFCEGLGWDLNRDRSVSLRADRDRDGVVTFTEIWTYTRRRVFFHLSGTGAEQTVMAWPEVSEFDLFARQSS